MHDVSLKSELLKIQESKRQIKKSFYFCSHSIYHYRLLKVLLNGMENLWILQTNGIMQTNMNLFKLEQNGFVTPAFHIVYQNSATDIVTFYPRNGILS